MMLPWREVSKYAELLVDLERDCGLRRRLLHAPVSS
jgi:hypothetical protein